MLNKEDTKDVAGAYGKAIAKKVKNATDDSKNNAKKNLYDLGKKNVGKAAAAKGMKNAFGSRETRAHSWKGREVSKEKFDMLSHQKSIVDRNDKMRAENKKESLNKRFGPRPENYKSSDHS